VGLRLRVLKHKDLEDREVMIAGLLMAFAVQ
jgi:hypothetical protein